MHIINQLGKSTKVSAATHTQTDGQSENNAAAAHRRRHKNIGIDIYMSGEKINVGQVR